MYILPNQDFTHCILFYFLFCLRYRARYPFQSGVIQLDSTPAHGRIPFVPKYIREHHSQSWQQLKFLWVKNILK